MGSKKFQIVLICILSFILIGMISFFGLYLYINNDNSKSLSVSSSNGGKKETINTTSVSKDITDVDVQTLTEPKTEEEKALSYGFYNYSDSLLQKLKNQQTKDYPQFGELKEEIHMIGTAFVDYGCSKSGIKKRDGVFEDKNSNSLYNISSKVFNYNAETLFEFDDNNQLISLTYKFIDIPLDNTDEFKNIRDNLIKDYEQPTFQNVFLTPKDKFDESKDKNVTYIVRWESSKKSVVLEYDKKEKDNLNNKLTLSYTLRN